MIGSKLFSPDPKIQNDLIYDETTSFNYKKFQMKEDYSVGENVWAKLKGYPWWPARVEAESNLPKKVASKKPKNNSVLWPVFFYGSRDYGWFTKDNLRPFKEHLDEFKNPARKSALFIEAMKQAHDPTLLEKIQEEEQRNMEIEEQAKAALNEEKTKEKANKRKPPARSNAEPSKTKKTAAAHSMKTRKNSGGFNGINISGSSERKKEPETRIEKLKQIRQLLQSAAIKKNFEDIEAINSYITELENTEVTLEEELEAKVGKVCRHIVANPIPENSYNLFERLKALVAKFRNIKHGKTDHQGAINKNSEIKESNGNDKGGEVKDEDRMESPVEKEVGPSEKVEGSIEKVEEPIEKVKESVEKEEEPVEKVEPSTKRENDMENDMENDEIKESVEEEKSPCDLVEKETLKEDNELTNQKETQQGETETNKEQEVPTPQE